MRPEPCCPALERPLRGLAPARLAKLGAAALLGLAAPATAAQQFQHQPGMLPGPDRWSEGVECADVDGDGDLDLLFADGEGLSTPGARRQNVLLINQLVPTGTLAFGDESTARLGVHLSHAKGVTTGDVNGDGWVDVLFANAWHTDLPFLYVNRGAAQPGFFDLESSARGLTTPLSSGSAQFGDLDDDGDLDLILGDGYLGSPAGRPRLYVNDGTGHFSEDAAALLASPKLAQMDVQLVDVDGDLDLDFFGVDRNANGGEPHYLMLNDGKGRFSDRSSLVAGTGNRSYEAEAGDLDGDRDVDLFFIGLSGLAEGVLRNDLDLGGGLAFSAQPALNDSTDDNEAALFDFDSDGDYDVVVASLGGTELAWRNEGGLAFTKQTARIQSVADSSLDITVGDLDNDGRFDLVTAQGESNSAQWANKVYLNGGVAVDDRPPVVTGLKRPLCVQSAEPTRILAAVRDAVLDDGVDYVTGRARYVVQSATQRANVAMTPGAFSPPSLQLAAGDSAIFTNQTAGPQSLEVLTAPYQHGLTLAPGQSHEVVFVAPLTYDVASSTNSAALQVTVTGSVTSVSSTHAGGGLQRFVLPDTLGGQGTSVSYELEFRDWIGNRTVLRADRIKLVPCAISSYCTARVNSLGCTPAIGWSGAPSASAGAGFEITAERILSGRNGLLFYGTRGQQAVPFRGGTLCVRQPLRRTPSQTSGGSGTGQDCTGGFSFDFNALLFAGTDPALVPGAAVDAQYYSRDPGSPSTVHLTDAIHFVVCP